MQTSYFQFSIGHLRVASCLCVKTSLLAKPFIWKCVSIQVHFHTNQTRFHMKGFARGLVLKQRHKGLGNIVRGIRNNIKQMSYWNTSWPLHHRGSVYSGNRSKPVLSRGHMFSKLRCLLVACVEISHESFVPWTCLDLRPGPSTIGGEGACFLRGIFFFSTLFCLIDIMTEQIV